MRLIGASGTPRLLRVERLAARQHLNHLGDLAGPARSSLRVASVTLVEDLFVVRLSVTVPAYRPGSHLEPCLDSPLEQGIDAEDYEDLRRRGSTGEIGSASGPGGAPYPVVCLHRATPEWPGQARNQVCRPR